ncbi:hypothetical protein HUJ05_007198 [Dendroctonus ponderosae]|nr:hypothetical protein HUJ05_007198 [Dendroctonus ponderosae]
MGCSRSRHNSDVPSLGPPSQFLPQRHDLISLVEKGRMGMSSNSSCCSSTTSSLGEKHGLAPTKVTAEVNEALRRTPDLRETRIDNQLYSKVESANLPEPADISRNRDSNQVFQCIVVMHPECEERAEDVDVDDTITIACEMEAKETADQGGRLNRCGHLEVALLYDAPMRKMTVHVLQARDIPKDVNSMGIRLRLYGCERMRRERLIGEAVVSFANINLELENNFWLTMESRSNTTLNVGSSKEIDCNSPTMSHPKAR